MTKKRTNTIRNDAEALILFVQWFGPWPEWIEFFVESCKWNREIDWLILTDQDPPENEAPNVRYRKVGFADHVARMSDGIGLDLSHVSPLKLCDLKPTLGHVFSVETEGYRNYGHCDIDLIFGDIRALYTDALLEKYEVLSTHSTAFPAIWSCCATTPSTRALSSGSRAGGARRWIRIHTASMSIASATSSRALPSGAALRKDACRPFSRNAIRPH